MQGAPGIRFDVASQPTAAVSINLRHLRASVPHRLSVTLYEDTGPVDLRGKDYMESLLIRTIVILTLIVALAALLIMGFLDVARQLLSRNIFATPSLSNEERAEESSGETGQA